MDDDECKEDTAVRCGMTLNGDWWKAKGPDLQARTMTANYRLRYNKLSRGGPEEEFGKWKMMHQIVVETHTKSTLRQFRIWTPCSRVKYRETLHAKHSRGSVWLSALGHKETVISDDSPHDLRTYNEAIWSKQWFVVIIVLTWPRWEGNVDFSAECWYKHRLIQNK